MGSSASKTASSTSSPTLNSPSPAIHRAFSFPTPLVHHPPARKGDSHHLVSLTSTSYGSLDGSKTSSSDQQKLPRISISGMNTADLISGDSLSPDSVINTWELMDGLDDEFEFESPKLGKPNFNLDSDHCPKPDPVRIVGCVSGSTLKLDESYEFEFESPKLCKPISSSDSDLCPKPDPEPKVSALNIEESYEFVRIEQEEEGWVSLSYSKPKQPLWKHLSEEPFLSGLDPSVVTSYSKALSSKQLSNVEPTSVCSTPLSSQAKAEDKIVLYFTTLRGIRKTYEDCCFVRTILGGLQVNVDERDISMDSNYRKELQTMVGDSEKPVCLPQVFIRGSHVGGVEEIMKLNDGGELAEMLRGFPASESLGTCRSCGDARFVPCTSCGGSTKVFEEEDERFKRCLKCNENGLVRCGECCL